MSQPLGVDVDLFEDFLEERWHEDAKCESSHSSGFECSELVVVRKRVDCTGRIFMVCANSYNWNLRQITKNENPCRNCGLLVAACWSVISV